MKEKEREEKEEKVVRNVIEKAVKSLFERCQQLAGKEEKLKFDLEVKYGVRANLITTGQTGVYKASYFQIYKVEKDKFFWIPRERCTPICFIKGEITKSQFKGEDYLGVELYDEIYFLPIIREEMERAASELNVKTKIICVHGPGPTLEEYA